MAITNMRALDNGDVEITCEYFDGEEMTTSKDIYTARNGAEGSFRLRRMNRTPTETRQTLGLSIAEIAQAMGVHRQTWTKWERGERQPDKAAVRLMDLLCWLHEHRAETLVAWMREI